MSEAALTEQDVSEELPTTLDMVQPDVIYNVRDVELCIRHDGKSYRIPPKRQVMVPPSMAYTCINSYGDRGLVRVPRNATASQIKEAEVRGLRAMLQRVEQLLDFAKETVNDHADAGRNLPRVERDNVTKLDEARNELYRALGEEPEGIPQRYETASSRGQDVKALMDRINQLEALLEPQVEPEQPKSQPKARKRS